MARFRMVDDVQRWLPQWVRSPLVERIILTQHDDIPIAVLLSIDEFRSIQAMLDLASDIDRLAGIYRIHDQIQAGDVQDFEELERVLCNRKVLRYFNTTPNSNEKTCLQNLLQGIRMHSVPIYPHRTKKGFYLPKIGCGHEIVMSRSLANSLCIISLHPYAPHETWRMARFVAVDDVQRWLPQWVRSPSVEHIVLTQNNDKPVAMLLSIDEFRSIQAMLDLTSDINRLADIYQIHDQVQAGNVQDFKELA